MPAFEAIRGKDSEPFRKLLKEAHKLLSLHNDLEQTTIDVHFKWNTNGIVAGAADSYHAVVVSGSVESKSAHQVTLPMDLAMKLGEIGGKFAIGESKVQAESDEGRVEMNQISERSSIFRRRTLSRNCPKSLHLKTSSMSTVSLTRIIQ